MTFETFLTMDRPRSSRWRRLTYALSLLLHGALLVVGVTASFWRVDELSPPSIPLTFATFSPPPPPPAPRAAGSRRNTPRPRPRAALTQPTPATVPAPTEATTDSEREGPAGNEIGSETSTCQGPHCIGIGDAPARFLPPTVARGQLAIDPQDERYRVHLPTAMATAGMSVWALVKICVGVDGNVSQVKILKSADPALDPTIVAVLRTWRYQPYTLDGRPVPFCTTVRYEISTR
jgi:TonB family protein